MSRSIPLFCLLLLLPAVCPAETIQAYVDRTRTRLDTPVTLTVSIAGRGATVDTDGIRDFEVQSQGTSTQVQIINGSTSETQSFQFLLIPKRTGRLDVPALPVTLHGKTYHTRPLSVLVTRTGSNTARADGGGRDIQLEARVSELSPYISQQIVCTVTLRFGVQVANTQFTPPDVTGFTAKQIGGQRNRTRIVDGRRYQEVMLSYLLIPINAGPLTIGPATLRCDTVSRRRQRRDFMDPFFSDPIFGSRQLTPRVLRSNPIHLKVRELPPAAAGQPPYSGLVGSFSMGAAIESRAIKVGDSDTLTVTLRGTGNIMDAGVPRMRVPDAFRQYADTPQSDIHLGPAGYRGKKVFRVALVPVRPGRYEVAPAAMSYFDPKAGRYRSLEVNPISLMVTKSNTAQEPPTVYSSGGSVQGRPGIRKEKVDFTGRDILSIKTGLDAAENRSGPSLTLFLATLGVPGLLFFLWMGAARLLRKDTRPAALMAQKAIRALKQAAAGDRAEAAAFLSNLRRALVYAVCARAGAGGEALTYAEARDILLKTRVSTELTDLVCGLMNDIDSARFGGVSLDPADRERLLTQAKRLIREVLP